eukprot:337209-Heterocapsa_arctica.AAC.1
MPLCSSDSFSSEYDTSWLEHSSPLSVTRGACFPRRIGSILHGLVRLWLCLVINVPGCPPVIGARHVLREVGRRGVV